MQASTYHPSGHVPRRGVIAILAAGLFAVSSAVAYAWLLAYVRPALRPDPQYFLSVFALLGVGIWMNLLLRRAATVGKIRNPALMGRVGAGLGMLAWYVQWVAYIGIGGIRGGGDEAGFPVLARIAHLCLRPDALFDQAFINPLIDASILVQGGLVFCWLVEFCVHVFPPMLAGRRRAGMPFCEASGQWAQEIEVEADFEPFADPEAAAQLLGADPGRFASMLVPRSHDPVGNHTRVTLYRCAGPESFLTIRHLVQAPVQGMPLPPDAINAMVGGSADVAYFWEQPLVERLRVPLPDPDALLRRWSGASPMEAELQPGPVLSKS